MPEGDATTIKFGDGLGVIDEGSNVIRVNASLGRTDLFADVTIDALDTGGYPTGQPNYFDITGIPGTYRDLFAVLSFQSVEGTTDVLLNNSTGDYFYASPHDPGDKFYFDTTADADNKIRLAPVGQSAGADRWCHYTILLPGYASLNWAKTFQIQGVAVGTDTPTGKLFLAYDLLGGVWLNTAPITRLTVRALGSGGFADGSRLRLYGRT